MLVCKDTIAYKCSEIKRHNIGNIHGLQFSILEPISHTDIANLFADNTFYFYDEILNIYFPYTSNKIVGLRIEYNADSTYKITIKLRRRKTT